MISIKVNLKSFPYLQQLIHHYMKIHMFSSSQCVSRCQEIGEFVYNKFTKQGTYADEYPICPTITGFAPCGNAFTNIINGLVTDYDYTDIMYSYTLPSDMLNNQYITIKVKNNSKKHILQGIFALMNIKSRQDLYKYLSLYENNHLIDKKSINYLRKLGEFAYNENEIFPSQI